MEYYPNNVMAEYVTRLPKMIDLKGEWEVGLVEMQYPRSWHNIPNNPQARRFKVIASSLTNANASDATHYFQISPGYYPSIQHLFDEIKRGVAQALNETQLTRIEFEVCEATRTISVTCNRCIVEVPPHIQEILSMGNSRLWLEGGTTTGEPFDLEPVKSLYVYCDLVEPRTVGDHAVPLLRIVPVEGKNGDLVTRIYDKAHYIPLQRKQFQTAEIYIRDHTGEKVPFERGTLNVTLHFRRSKHPL